MIDLDEQETELDKDAEFLDRLKALMVVLLVAVFIAVTLLLLHAAVNVDEPIVIHEVAE